MRVILSLFVLLILVGCAQSTLTARWVDQQYQPRPVKSMLVLALSDNLRVRRIFEDEMVEKLRALGVDARSGAVLFSQGLPEKTSIERYLANENIQTVLVAQLVDVENKTVQYPGSSYNTVGSFQHYYDSSYYYIYDDSYSVTYDYFNIEYTLFDVTNGQPIWSAESSTVDPENVNHVSAELSQLIINDMQKDQLVANQ